MDEKRINCGVEFRCIAKGGTCTGCTRNPQMPTEGLIWKHDRFSSIEENNMFYSNR